MNNKKLLIAVLIVAAVAVVLGMNSKKEEVASITEQSASTQVAAETASSATPEASPTIKEFTVTGKNYSFAPESLSVKKGDTVRLTFVNEVGNHDLRIDEFGVKTKIIKAGEKDTVEFIVDKVGTFEYYCSVGKHRENGMKGSFTVTE